MTTENTCRWSCETREVINGECSIFMFDCQRGTSLSYEGSSVTYNPSRSPALSVHHLHNGDFLLEALNVFHLALTEEGFWSYGPVITCSPRIARMRLGVVSNHHLRNHLRIHFVVSLECT